MNKGIRFIDEFKQDAVALLLITFVPALSTWLPKVSGF